MDFLRNPLSVALVEFSSNHSTFAASLLNERPPWADIQGSRAGAALWQESFKDIMSRSACPIAWVGLFIDAEGVWLLATANIPQQMSNMKSGLHTLLKPSIPKEQLQEVARTLRSFDELDKDRIAAWETVESLRAEVEDDDEDNNDEGNSD